MQHQVLEDQLGGHGEQHPLAVVLVELPGRLGDLADLAADQQAQIVLGVREIGVIDGILGFDVADQGG